MSAYVALGSERVARALLDAAGRVAGDAFSVKTATGSLRTGLHLEGVELRLGDTRVTAAVLDWRPGRLAPLRRHLGLGTISVADVRVTLGKGDGSAGSPLTLPNIAVPGRVTLDGLDARGIIIEPPDGAPQQIDMLHLAGQIEAGRIDLQWLGVRAPQGALDAALRIDLSRRGALDGVLTAVVNVPGQAPVRLAGEVGGAIDGHITASLATSSPSTARLVADIDRPLDNGAWHARLWADAAPLATWRADLPPWVAALDARASGQGAAARVVLDYRLDGTPAGTVQGTASAKGEGTIWTLAADMRAAQDLHLTATGQADLARRSGEARLDWQALRWPLGPQPAQVRSPAGNAQISGTVDDWQATLSATLLAAQMSAGTGKARTGRVEARLHGSDQRAEIDALDARLLDGRLHATGAVTWAPTLDWSASVQAQGLDPALLWPEWPGRVAGDIDARGGAGAANIHLVRLDGSLRGRPLAGAGQVAWQPDRVQLSAVDVRLGSARLRAAGTVLGAGPPLVGTLDVPDAGDLLPAAHGRLHADWRLAGPGLTAASVAIDGGDLTYGDIAASRLTGRFDFDRTKNRLGLRIDAPDLTVGAHRLALHTTADGTPGDHAFDATLTRGDVTLALRGRGSVLADGWRARVARGALRGAPPATWELAGPLQLDLHRDLLVVNHHCWRAGNASLCAGGRRAARVLDVAVDLKALPIAPLVALTGDDVTVEGALDGRVRLQQDAGVLSGELHLTAPPGAVVTHTPDGEPRRFEHGGLRIDGQLAAQGGQLHAHLAQPEGSGDLIGAVLRLPPLPAGAAAPLQGHLDAQLPDIGLFQPWAPALVGLAGSATAQLRVDGTLAAPRVSGTASLRGGVANVPALGIELREMTADVQGDGGDTLRLTGSARSGEGTLALSGTASQSGGGRVDLALTGDGFRAIDTPALEATITPKLDIALAGSALSVTGDVTIPSARIHAQDRPPTVQTSPDVVVRGRAPAASAPLAAKVDVRVAMGDDVRVDAYGFKGRLGGAARVQQAADGATAVSGQITVRDGQYTFYGQRLPVTQGELRYAGGPPDDPALRIKAERRVGDVKAGVRIVGTAKAPQTQLFSTPAMPQSDIISYLVLGRPAQQAKGSEGDLLMQAAASAGLRGGSALVKRMGQALGFEDAELSSSGDGGANLALGRSLSSRLYVGYGMALADQTNAVTLRYKLTQRWLLEVVTGLTQTVDLLYQFER